MAEVGCLVGLFVYSFIYKALLNFPSVSFHQTYSQIPNTFHCLEFCTQSDFLFISTDSPCTNLSSTHCMFSLCFSHLPISFMIRILLQLFSLLFTLCLHLAGSSQSSEIILNTMSLAQISVATLSNHHILFFIKPHFSCVLLQIFLLACCLFFSRSCDMYLLINSFD